MFGAWIRRKGFWILDLMKGGNLAKIMKDIQSIGIDDGREDQLDYILSYAKGNVPYYQGLNAKTLSDFPIMNKTVFKREGDRCISMEYTDKNSLHKVTTSGSTGIPLTVYLDPYKRQRVVADLINAHSRVGWELGDKFVFIRNWTSNYNQSRIKSIMQNVINVSISDFGPAKKDWLTEYLLANPGTVIFGYASAVCDYMNHLSKQEHKRIPFVKLIVCDSDELTIANKNKLQNMFKCPVINRYDNEENGLLAITTNESDVFITNYQSLIIELLSLESNEPVKPGEVGRVVVTDLYNRAMPLIRYDTGDCAISKDASDKIRHLEKLCGRAAVYLTSVDGKKISSVGISAITEIFNGIERYQLVQNSNNSYVFKYSGILTNNDLLLLLKRLKGSLGETAEIQFDNVDRIEPNKNNKFSSIVNNCK